MNPAQIQEKLEALVNNYSSDEFIYDLLRSYGLAKASITRLKKGEYNLSNNGQEVIWKNKVYYKEAESDKLYDVIDELSTNKKVRSHDLRFIIVTDHERLLAEDTKTKENRDIAIEDLPKHFDFFLPWAGMEKRQHVNENPADVKAAEKLAKLFDEIKKNNATKTDKEVHSLNVFLSRLLFCFFAEDTGIFEENLFTSSVSSYTKGDGSDLDTYFEKLFAVLNDKDRKDTAAYLNEFPYVNGGLFKEHHPAPEFSRKSRQVVIECGEQDWAKINPDIFGSMMQAVITPDKREGLGMHYTSVPNIMKVIEPLFLNDLYDEFEKNKFKPRKLHKLLDRISKFKIFDPACGSGNFLVIAYKQLRYFEIKVLKQLQKLQKATNSLDSPQKELIPKSQLSLASSHQLPLFSRIQLSQFYGIEIDDFAHEIAQLSLWLAEHQMNATFYEEFGQSEPTLPLKDAGNIFHGNATRLDWKNICEPSDDKEIFLLGNPPYQGSNSQSKSQKKDMKSTFEGISSYKKLDYIGSFFLKGARYIENNSVKLAFVTTNSICQGEQVILLWPHIFNLGIEIGFAHQSFKWSNNAKNNAGVTCVIIGLRNNSSDNKYLINKNVKKRVNNINAYLADSENILVKKESAPISNLPEMTYGNKAVDWGYLKLSQKDKEDLISEWPRSKQFIKRFMGANEFLKDWKKWCLWIHDQDLNEALEIQPINERIQKVKEERLASPDSGANELAERSHQFRDTNKTSESSVIVPLTTSENRKYIPIGFVGSDTIVSNAVSVLYDTQPWIFGLISSLMHMVWVKAIAGRLETRLRYSSVICYNTFPIPNLDNDKKENITKCAYEILKVREEYPEKTIASLYSREKMPDKLKKAHNDLDHLVDSYYSSKSFKSDEDRLEVLFDLYQKKVSSN